MASGNDTSPNPAELTDSEKLNYLIKQSLTQTSTLNSIQAEIGALTARIGSLHTAVTENQTAIQHCQEDIEGILQYQRRNNLVLNGIPEEENEDLFKIFEVFTAAAGFPLTATDLDTIHRIPTRVQNKPRPIVVRFTNRWKKEALMKKKPRLTSSDLGLPVPNLKVTYSQHLTAFQRNLLARAFDLKAQWGGAAAGAEAWQDHGRIFVKKPGDSRGTPITSINQLVQLGLRISPS